MRRYGRKMILAALAATAGCVYASGCMQTAALSLNPCGTLFAFCTADDWLRAIDPLVTYPDFELDPSCTMPYQCGDYPIAP